MRDRNLDIIKGLACILMIFAHSKTLGRTIDTSFTEPFWYLGFFAPILFFASIGVSLIFQLQKRKVFILIIFNILLFAVSFADRGRESLSYINFTNPNLIGSLALATIFVIIFRKFNGLILLIVLLFLDRIANRTGMPPTIIYGIPFALIPWAGITALGKFLYENKTWRIYILALGSLITLYSYVYRGEVLENQFLTTLFLGMSLMIYSFSLISSDKISGIKGISAILTYLGKNTILFYWIHLFILFSINFKLPAILMWLFILFASISLIIVSKKINHYTFEKLSSRLPFWLVLVLLIFAPHFLNLSLNFHFYFFSLLTIIFALNYHNFFKLAIIRKFNK